VLRQGPADLAAKTAVPFASELGDGLGELGFDSSADVYQVVVDCVL
jgi:hypothetical protein